MKTAISIDDSLMEEADQAAQNLGLSRSGLIADALRHYLQNRRQNKISERLNEVYANAPNPIERHLTRRLKTKLPVQKAW